MNAVQSETRPRPVRFRGRSYLAFSLAPEPPITDWLADLDAAIDRSSGFFVGRPAVLDLGNTTLSQSAIALLVQELEAAFAQSRRFASTLTVHNTTGSYACRARTSPPANNSTHPERSSSGNTPRRR